MLMTQTTTVKEAIEICITNGMTDKYKIYDNVVRTLECPRPTVRRCAAELRNDYLAKVKILENKSPTDHNSFNQNICTKCGLWHPNEDCK